MKKFLLATAAVLASTSAYAADYAVVHPFYTPAQGKFVSETSLEYTHEFRGDKNGAMPKETRSDKTISETVEYGVTDDVQVGLSVARNWEKTKNHFADGTGLLVDTEKEYVNSWQLDAGYNVINDGKTFLNVGVSYSQSVGKDKPFDPAFEIKNDVHGKFIGLNVKGGYNFDGFTVFGNVGYIRQIDGEKEFNNGGWIRESEKTKDYSLEAGVFKAFNDQISAWTSLSADIEDGAEREYSLNAGTNYSFSKDMAVGVKAAYVFENDVRGHDYDVFTGVRSTRKDQEMHRIYKLGVDFTIAF